MEIAILLMVLGASAVFIFAPLFRQGEAAPAPTAPLHQETAAALSRRDATYQALADLEEDREAGKLSDDDHASLKQAYEADAVRALRDLDRLAERSETGSS